MHKDKFVFSQLIVFLDRNKFNYIVRKHDGDKYVKHFTCWNQLLSLMFGQLSNRKSLRDLIIALMQITLKLPFRDRKECIKIIFGKSQSR